MIPPSFRRSTSVAPALSGETKIRAAATQPRISRMQLPGSGAITSYVTRP
jgi:hypothetical protein